MSEQGKPEDDKADKQQGGQDGQAEEAAPETSGQASASSPALSESEARADSKSATAHVAKSGGGGKGLAALALLLAIVVAAAAGGAAYWFWPQWQALQASQSNYLTEGDLAPVEQNVESQLRAIEDRVGQRLQRLSEEDQQRSRTVVDLREAVAQLQRNERQQADRIAELRDRLQADGDALLRSEAAFLARTAVHVVRYNRDIDGALDALKKADALLARKGGQYVAERKAVAEAIDVLLDVRPPKTDRLALRLEALIETVNVLPLAQGYEPMSSKPQAAAAEGLAEEAGWRARLNRAWQRTKDALGELVVIQRQAEVQPLLAPSQRYFLYQNLRLRLEAARAALLAQDESLYARSLGRAQEWVDRYYARNSDAVQAALAEIESLAAQPVSSQTPDIENLLQPLIELD